MKPSSNGIEAKMWRISHKPVLNIPPGGVSKEADLNHLPEISDLYKHGIGIDLDEGEGELKTPGFNGRAQNIMNKGNTINILLVLAIALLLGVTALWVSIRPTSDQVAVVKAVGLHSGPVGHLESALQSKAGVAAVEVDTNKGWVVVGFDSTVLKLEHIASMIAEMGYSISAAEAIGIDRFTAMMGRLPGANPDSVGCGGACARR